MTQHQVHPQMVDKLYSKLGHINAGDRSLVLVNPPFVIRTQCFVYGGTRGGDHLLEKSRALVGDINGQKLIFIMGHRARHCH